MRNKPKFQNLKLKYRDKLPYLIALLLFVLTFFFIVYNQLYSSLFFQKKDRTNIVFYGKNTVFFSIGKYDGVHYFISFYPDVKVKVPGGYGNFRVGGLLKLASLKKNDDIFRKTFSITTSASVDKYFYDKTQEIYYGKDKRDEDTITLPTYRDIFFTSSNSNLFDRLYVYFLFFGKQRRQFSKIDYKSNLGTDEEFFQDKDFAKEYQGFLYNRIYRKEQRTVQILYGKSYKTALFLSKIIEGDGIRVVDISEDIKTGEACQVRENSKNFSQSARDLSLFFGCDLMTGLTESSDIIIKLGKLEEEWGIL